MLEEKKSNSLEKENSGAMPGWFLNPEKIVSELEIFLGMSVAHFGCGTGFFSFAIAKKVGENGMVWALDILDNKVALVRSQSRALGIGNIVAERKNLEDKNGSGLEDESADWVVIVNMLYQVEKKSRVILEAKRILKDTGRILIIDWKDISGGIGPEKSQRVSREDLIKIAKKNGLGILREMEVSRFNFGMILTK